VFKKINFVAVAAVACSGAAYAQTNVTVYGALDAGVLNMSSISGGAAGYVPSAVEAGSFTGLKDGGIGGSNIGVKGERDIGGGKKAYFQLQGNLNLKDGSTGGPNSSSGTSNINQLALIGFSGNAGDLKLGRVVSPMYYAMASTDAREGRYFGSTLTGLVGLNSASGYWIANNSNAAFGTVYNDNSVVYTSPKLVDTVISVQHAFGNTAGNSTANSQDAVTAMYSKDGLSLSALYYNGSGNGLANATTLAGSAANAAAAGFTSTANTNRLTSVGAKYKTGSWTFSYATFEAKNPAGAKLSGGSTNLTMDALGAAYELTADIKLSTGYYSIKDKTNDGHKATQSVLGLDYTLFKDTIVYVQTASTNNTGSNMNLSPVYATVPAANKSNTATMVGARYTF
jgi:predicted porin